jgi:hypothetical protein
MRPPAAAPHLADGAEGLAEEVVVELLEARARERLRQVDALGERLDLDADLVLARQRALGALRLAAQLLQRARVACGAWRDGRGAGLRPRQAERLHAPRAAAQRAPCRAAPRPLAAPPQQPCPPAGPAGAASPVMSLLYFFLISLMKYSITRWSKSSPPRWVSPWVAITSNTPAGGRGRARGKRSARGLRWRGRLLRRLPGRPAQRCSRRCPRRCPSQPQHPPLSIVRMDTSKVPPPRSNTRMFFSPPFLSRPYAIAAAVGSLMMRTTLRPARGVGGWDAAAAASAGRATTHDACAPASPAPLGSAALPIPCRLRPSSPAGPARRAHQRWCRRPWWPGAARR